LYEGLQLKVEQWLAATTAQSKRSRTTEKRKEKKNEFVSF